MKYGKSDGLDLDGSTLAFEFLSCEHIDGWNTVSNCSLSVILFHFSSVSGG